MLRKSLALGVVFVVFVACRDGPVAVVGTGGEGWYPPNDATPVVDLVAPVSALMSDHFVRALTVQAVGQTAADNLAVSLEPPAQDVPADLTTAIRALVALRIQLHAPRPATAAGQTEGASTQDDPEERIVQDALSLVVDDALDVLATAPDSMGGE